MTQEEMEAAIEAAKNRRLGLRPDDPRGYRGPVEPGRVSVAAWIVYFMLLVRDIVWIWIGGGTAGAFSAAAAFGVPPFPLGIIVPLFGVTGCFLAMAHLLDAV